jgi:hypothetical protein
MGKIARQVVLALSALLSRSLVNIIIYLMVLLFLYSLLAEMKMRQTPLWSETFLDYEHAMVRPFKSDAHTLPSSFVIP